MSKRPRYAKPEGPTERCLVCQGTGFAPGAAQRLADDATRAFDAPLPGGARCWKCDGRGRVEIKPQR